MGALGEKRGARCQPAAQVVARIGDVRADAFGRRGESAQHLVGGGDVRDPERLQEESGLAGERLETRAQRRGAVELRNPDRAASRNGLVRGSDAAQRRPDLRIARRGLARGVEQAVIGEDHGRAIGDEQVLADLDARGAHRVDLRQQRVEIEDDPAADDGRAAPDDPGRQQVEREVPVAELDGVTGVVTAVIAGDHVESVGEQVDDLSLTLVAPLPAQNGQSLHAALLVVDRKKQGRVTEFRDGAPP